MGRPTPTPSDAMFLILLCCTLVVGAGCAPSPAKVDQGWEVEPVVGADYLRGVPTDWSARLADVGDVTLLGDDSTMREALVGGDREVVVAATLFEAEGTYSLDLIVLNRQGEPLQLTRADLQLVDADGRWFEPVVEWDEGERYGLRGRRVETTESEVVYEIDRDIEAEQAMLMQDLTALLGDDPEEAKRRAERRRTRRRVTDEDIHRGAKPELSTVNGSPSRVVVPPRDGRAFWGYFRADDPVFPLTAMVVVGDEQVLFRFDR